MLLYNIAKSNRPTGQYYQSFYGLLSEDPSELSFKIVSPVPTEAVFIAGIC